MKSIRDLDERKWARLAGQLLEEAAGVVARRCCNDWPWPADWSQADRVRLAFAMVRDNYKIPDGTALSTEQHEEVMRLTCGKYGPADWWVMKFLADRLKTEEYDDG